MIADQEIQTGFRFGDRFCASRTGRGSIMFFK
jgi:hypothetical protein